MFLGLSSVVMGGYPEIFLGLVATNFAVNCISFLFSMYARGNLSEAAGCLFLEFGGSGRMLKSFDEGTMRGERPGFVASPKETVAIEHMPLRHMPFEYGMIGVNALGVAYTAAYGLNLLPAMAGTAEIAAAGFWCAFHLFFQAYAVSKFNRGVFSEPPYMGTIRAMWKHLSDIPGNMNAPCSTQNDKAQPHRLEEGGKDL